MMTFQQVLGILFLQWLVRSVGNGLRALRLQGKRRVSAWIDSVGALLGAVVWLGAVVRLATDTHSRNDPPLPWPAWLLWGLFGFLAWELLWLAVECARAITARRRARRQAGAHG
jgi:hypothetical protein